MPQPEEKVMNLFIIFFLFFLILNPNNNTTVLVFFCELFLDDHTDFEDSLYECSQILIMDHQ